MPKLIIDTPDYWDSIVRLKDVIKVSGEKFDFVYGIPRAGLPLATYLSYMLDIPLITHIKHTIIDKVNTYLIVDELCDTGTTFLNFKHDWDGRIKYKTACFYTKKHTRYMPDFVSMTPALDNDVWLVFPYENPSVDPVEETQKHLKKSMDRLKGDIN